jgi:hypothetical protein
MTRGPNRTDSSALALAVKLAIAGAFLIVLMAVLIGAVRAFLMQQSIVAVALPLQPGRVVPLTPPNGNAQQGPSGPTFTGTVVDSQTHQPINGATPVVMVGYGPLSDRPTEYFLSAGQYSTGGQYSARAESNLRSTFFFFVRVAARGYLPAVSVAQTGSATLNFELTPANDIIGHVFGTDGKPESGVSLVAVVPGLQTVTLRDGALSAVAAASATSGPDGAYDLPPQCGDYVVVACGPDGIARANRDDIAKSTDIHLLPWGRVEGRAMVSTHPAAGSRIAATSTDYTVLPMYLWPPIVSFTATTQADNEGHFLFTKVPPGPLHIRRRLAQTLAPQYPQIINVGYTQFVWTTVVAGKTATANLGGGGREVLVNIRFPKSVSVGRYGIRSGVTSLPAAPVVPEMPDDVKNGAAELRNAWMHDFLATPAGRAYLPSLGPDAPNQPSYALEYSDGDTFHIEDVQAGDYQIGMSVGLTGGPPGPLPMIRFVHTYFTMPPITPDTANKPLVLPDIILTTN